MSKLKECRWFKKYKAIHRPKCECIPCREKYIDKLLESHTPQWQPISTAPEDVDILLMKTDDKGRPCVVKGDVSDVGSGVIPFVNGAYSETITGHGFDRDEFVPTHWMPLPNPPEEK